MDDHFDQLRGILERALDLPPSERAAFVQEVCGSDADLLEEATALVAGLREDTFLSPAPAPAPMPRERGRDIQEGTQIGGYRLGRLLGEGGMGTVYEAEQETPRRQVALKLLGRSVRSPGARERFRYEVEVLGTLRHPGIAQIFEAGIHPRGEDREPVPWFAMELVAGASTLLAHAEANHLGEGERLQLFMEVLGAVQHGHRKGVIHRDLKPDNILVDRRGRAKVIDFGVARVADPAILAATLRTQAAEIVGTLAYMSPEQVSGKDVDTRTDVYSLGVVLYELLTGQLPIDVRKTDFITSARRIAEEPPRRPRQAHSEIKSDLEAILLKTLEKDPVERYDSAGVLADDLRRYRAGEPIEARSVGALHRLRLFARRHRVLVASACVVLLVTLAAAAVSFDFALHSRDAEREASTERDRFAVLYHSQFQQNIETVTVDANAIADLYGGGPIALRMIRAAVARLEELEATSPGTPEFRLQLADSYRRLAHTLSSLSNDEEDVRVPVQRALARSLALVNEVLSKAPEDPQAHGLRAEVLTTYAAMDSLSGDQDAASEWLGDAEQALRRAGSPVHIRKFLLYTGALIGYRRRDLDPALKSLSERIAFDAPDGVPTPQDTPRSRVNLAAAYRLRAEILRRLRRFHQAQKDLEHCDDLRQGLVKEHPERRAYRLDRASTWMAMGYVMMALGEREGVESWYERAHDELQRLHEEAPLHMGITLQFARALQGLGRIDNTRAIHDHPKGSRERVAGLQEALKHYERAIALTRTLAARRPSSGSIRDTLTDLEKVSAFTRRVIERTNGPATGATK